MRELALLGLQETLEPLGSQEELRALSDRYNRIGGYSIEQLGTPGPAPAT